VAEGMEVVPVVVADVEGARIPLFLRHSDSMDMLFALEASKDSEEGSGCGSGSEGSRNEGSGSENQGSGSGNCKGTSIHFLTSPILSHSSPVHMYSYFPPLYQFQGLHLKPTTFRPNGPMTFQKLTHQ
jgi:hypothetical protein